MLDRNRPAVNTTEVHENEAKNIIKLYGIIRLDQTSDYLDHSAVVCCKQEKQFKFQRAFTNDQNEALYQCIRGSAKQA